MKRMRDGSYTIKPTYTVGDNEIVPDMLARRAAAQPDQIARSSTRRAASSASVSSLVMPWPSSPRPRTSGCS